MTREEVEELTKWPDGYSCHSCKSDHIKYFGYISNSQIKFGCIECNYIWYEDVLCDNLDDRYEEIIKTQRKTTSFTG